MKKNELVKLLMPVVKDSSGHDLETRTKIILAFIEERVAVSYEAEQEPELTKEDLEIIE